MCINKVTDFTSEGIGSGTEGLKNFGLVRRIGDKLTPKVVSK